MTELLQKQYALCALADLTAKALEAKGEAANLCCYHCGSKASLVSRQSLSCACCASGAVNYWSLVPRKICAFSYLEDFLSFKQKVFGIKGLKQSVKWMTVQQFEEQMQALLEQDQNSLKALSSLGNSAFQLRDLRLLVSLMLGVQQYIQKPRFRLVENCKLVLEENPPQRQLSRQPSLFSIVFVLGFLLPGVIYLMQQLKETDNSVRFCPTVPQFDQILLKESHARLQQINYAEHYLHEKMKRGMLENQQRQAVKIIKEKSRICRKLMQDWSGASNYNSSLGKEVNQTVDWCFSLL